MSDVLSAALRARYAPALPSEPSSTQLAWLLIRDWTITDDDRRAIIARIAVFQEWATEADADEHARIAVANLAAYTLRGEIHYLHACARSMNGYEPCETCGKMTKACRGCGACVGCGSELAGCGCCVQDCNTPCDICECCNACGSCECPNCDHCGERVSEVCDRCHCCTEDGGCCTCVDCQDCGRRVDRDDAYYSDHSGDYYCDGCAPCGDEDTREIEADGTIHTAEHPRDRKAFNSRRLAGCEVEFTQCDNFSHLESWCEDWGSAINEDGSCGWEAVTSPAAGDPLMRQISALGKALSRAGADESEKCGVHVHVDARDLLWPDIARMARLWERLEPAMYLLAGQERLSNQRYCAPWGSTLVEALDKHPNDPKTALLGAFLQISENPKGYLASLGKSKSAPDKKAGYRYRSLNFAPWVARYQIDAKFVSRDYTTGESVYEYSRRMVKDATLEFRLHGHTLDAAELRPWVRLCVRIVEWVATHTDRDLERLPRSAFRAMVEIAPDCKAWILDKVRSYRRTWTRRNRRVRYCPRFGWTTEHMWGTWRAMNAPTFTLRGVQTQVSARIQDLMVQGFINIPEES